MTDHFEQAKDDILKHARANGGVTPDDLLDALIATNKDLDEKLEMQRKEAVTKHDETKTWHQEVSGMVAQHIEESKERDRRLDALETGLEAIPDVCLVRQTELHQQVHTLHLEQDHAHAPRREGDPTDSTFSDERKDDEEGAEMRVVYRASKWLIRGIVAALITVLVVAAANFYLLRTTSKNEIRVDKGDLHALILLLEKEHTGSPLPIPSITPTP